MFCPGVDLSSARVTWEVGDQEPVIGATEYSFVPSKVIRQWIEAEAVLPDGRRVSAAGEFAVRAVSGLPTLSVEDETVALWHLDGDLTDAGPNGFELVAAGAVEWVEMASGWMAEPSGMAMRFHDLGDQLTLTIPDSYLSPGQTCTPLSIEAQICVLGFTAQGRGNDPFLELDQGYGSELGFTQKMWADPPVPFGVTGMSGGTLFRPAMERDRSGGNLAEFEVVPR